MPFSGCVYSMCGIKKGKLCSQAVLRFMIGQSRSCPHCTELASGDCQDRPGATSVVVVAED